MKKLSKVLVLVLSAIMVLAMSASVFAQTVPSGKGGSGEITIQNASKGIHYTVTKIFDATYNSTTKTVAYTYSGTLPTNDYFEQNATTGAITIKDAGKDAEGNLIGIAFDGNWESLSGDINFDNDLQRCIAVDIRYVLFVIDKLGNCQRLINEMKIIQ